LISGRRWTSICGTGRVTTRHPRLEAPFTGLPGDGGDASALILGRITLHSACDRTIHAARWGRSIARALTLTLAGGASLAGGSADWWTQIDGEIRRSEYQLTWQKETSLGDVASAWHAPNRAHGFRTYFTEAGIRVIPRVPDSSTWEWGLRLVGFGRGETFMRVGSPILSARDIGIEYERGTINEWYRNDPSGLEQGFTLMAPPAAAGEVSRDPLRIELSLTGTLSPLVAEDGKAIDFVDSRGARILRYAELVAKDARDELLPARMEAFAGDGIRGIRLLVHDRDAAYPIRIDPLTTSPAWTAESDQASAHFGIAVGTAGDVNGDGYSDVIVGAPDYDNGQTDEGRVFVFHGSPSGPSATASFSAEGDQISAHFGIAVGTAGDVNGDGYSDAIIGAHLYDNGETDEGRAFVYQGSSTGLGPTASWTGEINQAGAQYGFSVGTAGDVNGDGYSDVIVGAPMYTNGQSSEGAAFVYHGGAAGLAVSPNFTTESNQVSAWLGYAVSTARDMDGDGYSEVLVGAPQFDGPEVDEGVVFIYHGAASGLSSTAWGRFESNQAGAAYGTAVSWAGDVNGDGYADAVAGAPRYDSGQTDEGRIFVLRGRASGPLPVRVRPGRRRARRRRRGRGGREWRRVRRRPRRCALLRQRPGGRGPGLLLRRRRRRTVFEPVVDRGAGPSGCTVRRRSRNFGRRER